MLSSLGILDWLELNLLCPAAGCKNEGLLMLNVVAKRGGGSGWIQVDQRCIDKQSLGSYSAIARLPCGLRAAGQLQCFWTRSSISQP